MTIECRLSHNLKNLKRHVIEKRIDEIKKTYRIKIYLTLLHYDEKELSILLHSCSIMNMYEIEGILLEIMNTLEYTMTHSFLTAEELLYVMESYALSQEEKSEWIEHFKEHLSLAYIGLSSHECPVEISKVIESRKIREYIQELENKIGRAHV